MKELMKRIRADYLLSSLLTIALGIFFIAHPKATFSAVGLLVAVILIIIGVIYISGSILNLGTSGFSVFVGGVLLLIGIWILIQPAIVMALVPIILGVLLFWHGIRGMKSAVDAKGYGYERWYIGFITSVISIVFGIFFVVNAFGVLEFATIVFGIGLIFNGISNIFCVGTESHYHRQYDKNHPIDVDFIEDRDK